MKHLVIFFLILFYSATVQAQETNVSFHIINQKGEGLPFATISLTSTDSIRSYKKVADSTGRAVFASITPGNYHVNVTAVDIETVEKGVNIAGENPSFTIETEVRSSTLNTVVVSASRPLTRQEDDKTIIDPESLAASSTSTYEVLEKTPGLFVDQDGNIYINSMTPAQVYINGREQKMSRQDIATILKSLPPNSILSIEIMRTPSARYDASGSGGIVNVVLKKGVKIGLTGSVHAGFNHGDYGNRQTGFSINNSK